MRKDQLDAAFYQTTAQYERKLWDEKIAVGVKRQEQVLKDKDEHFRLKAQLKTRGNQLIELLDP